MLKIRRQAYQAFKGIEPLLLLPDTILSDFVKGLLDDL